jgi:hypothetical protein
MRDFFMDPHVVCLTRERQGRVFLSGEVTRRLVLTNALAACMGIASPIAFARHAPTRAWPAPEPARRPKKSPPQPRWRVRARAGGRRSPPLTAPKNASAAPMARATAHPVACAGARRVLPAQVKAARGGDRGGGRPSKWRLQPRVRRIGGARFGRTSPTGAARMLLAAAAARARADRPGPKQ